MAESTLNLRITGDDAEAMKVMLRMTQQQLKMAQSMRDIGTESGKAGRKIQELEDPAKAVSDHFAGIARGAAGMVTGLASLSGLIGAIKQYSQWLDRVRDLQVEITSQGMGPLAQYMPLAQQIGDSSEAGLMRAQRLTSAVSMRTGAGTAISRKAVQAALSSPQFEGGDAARMRVAEQVSALVARSGGGEQEVSAIMELLGAAGARSPEQAGGVLSRLQGALLASRALGMGPFGEAAIRSTVPWMAMGGTLEGGLKAFTQAREVSGGSEQEAASLLNQVVAILGTEGAEGVIAKQLGIPRSKVADLGVDERVAAFGGAMASASAKGPGEVARLLKRANVESKRRRQIITFFSEPARMAGEAAMRGMGKFTPEDAAAEELGYRTGPVAAQRRTETRIENRQIQSALEYGAASRLRLEARERLREAEAAGEVYFGEGYDWLRRLNGDPSLIERYEGRVLRERLGLPADDWGGPDEIRRWYGIPEGMTPESVEDLPAASRQRVARYIKEAQMMGRGSSGGSTVINHNYGDVYDFAGRRDMTKPGENAPSVGLD